VPCRPRATTRGAGGKLLVARANDERLGVSLEPRVELGAGLVDPLAKPGRRMCDVIVCRRPAALSLQQVRMHLLVFDSQGAPVDDLEPNRCEVGALRKD